MWAAWEWPEMNLEKGGVLGEAYTRWVGPRVDREEGVWGGA